MARTAGVFILWLTLQTADSELARLEEWAKSQPDTGPGQIGVGDEYYKAIKKFPKERQLFLDKANEWWAKGWPNLDPFWKDKTRANLRKIYAGHGNGGPLREWACGQFVKGDVSSAVVHSGGCSMRLLPQKTNIGLAEAATVVVKFKGVKEIAASFWTFSDGTDGSETAVVHVYDGKGKEIATGTFSFHDDTPVWVKAETTIKIPDGAESARFIYLSSSKAGQIYVDDVSVKADGKELVQNGSFEK